MKNATILLFLMACMQVSLAQTGGVISGRVLAGSEDRTVFAIQIEDTALGTTTDTAGYFRLSGVPVGEQMVLVSALGFKTVSRLVEVGEGSSLVLEVAAQPDILLFDEVVVSASRAGVRRREASVLVNLLDRETMEASQAVCLADGLNYQPGLRTETDCQTCNYTQLRMNGLGGGYSQILINSRPIFSALSGLYGLEQIPVNMIDRVEVVRGGGSALFGSSAVAGTVNVITRDPQASGFEASLNHGLIDGQAHDNNLQLNVASVGEKGTSGLTLFGARRARQPYDANGDGFSEMPRLLNYSFGANAFLKPSDRFRAGLSLNSINEDRDGGDLLDKPPHQRTQSESRTTNLLAGNFDLTWTTTRSGQLMVYGGAQHTKRRHYTGLFGADGYGLTNNYTLQGGLQVNRRFEKWWLGPNTLTAGLEHQVDDVWDKIPAYAYLIDQTTRQWGAFFQSDWQLAPRFQLMLGGRLTRHNLVAGWLFNPRLGILYELLPDLRLRASYASGFRAPQAFDTDLHIAFAGGGITTIRIDPALAPEYSDSYSFSFDFDRPTTHSIYGFSLSGFFTRLRNTFVLEEAGTDGQGNLQLEKRNGSGSAVSGLTFEARVNWENRLEFDAAFTLQRSEYDSPVTWSADVPGTTAYLRTPNRYGYFTLTLFNDRPLRLYLTGVYTGPMGVPHFGGAPGVEEDRLETSGDFLETNIKWSYDIDLGKGKSGLQVFSGVQNLFNAYQSDFDTGPYRDSNYVYGPARPRTFFLGLKWKSW